MNCKVCSSENPDNAMFCSVCGSPIEKPAPVSEDANIKLTCKVCGSEISDNATFCSVCGSPVAKPAPVSEDANIKLTCKVCGSEISDNATFCSVCGSPVAKTASVYKAPVPNNPVPNNRDKKKITKSVLSVVAVLLILAGASTLIYHIYCTRYKPSTYLDSARGNWTYETFDLATCNYYYYYGNEYEEASLTVYKGLPHILYLDSDSCSTEYYLDCVGNSVYLKSMNIVVYEDFNENYYETDVNHMYICELSELQSRIENCVKYGMEFENS